MPKPLSFGSIEVNLTASGSHASAVPDPETPFRIVLLGDFSGRSNQGREQLTGRLADRKPLRIDRDNLDQVLARLRVELQLSVAGADAPRLTIPFAEMDDFHPDPLFQRLELFQSLRRLRVRLSNPSTFVQAADEMRRWIKAPAAPTAPEPPTPPPINSENLLDQILGATSETTQRSPPVPDADWQSYLHKIVQPYAVPKFDGAKQAELLALVDEATSGQMRSILHHPDFQALEAAWRSVAFLVRRIDTNAQLKLFLVDVSRAELAADLTASEELGSTGLYRLLVEQTIGTTGAEPWSLVVGNYTFDQTPGDVELLGRLARIASAAGAPFLAAASERVLGCEELQGTPDPDDWRDDPEGNARWETLRRLPEAAALGLALPRLLLRLPYGKETVPTEQFHFEELPAKAPHACFLWGNPAHLCACLIAQAFSEYGWALRPGVMQDVDGLPLYVYKEDGESILKPSAEALLSARAAEAIGGRGLMPVLAHRNGAAVRVGLFQPVGKGARMLQGRWRS
jgi:type VI secretion system protein ImpC